MSRSAIFRKLILSALFLVAATLIPLDVYVTRAISRSRLATAAAQATAVHAIHLRIFEAALLECAIALGLAALVATSLARRVGRLRKFAEGLPEAPRSHLLTEVSADDELGGLARALGATAERLGSLVEQAKAESAQQRALLATMIEGVLAVDDRLRITYSNLSFAGFVGVRAPIRDGTPLAEVVRHPALSDMLGEVLRSGEVRERHLTLVQGTEERAFEVEASPLATPAGRGAFAVLYDITKLERLERVRRDFVANVSHELRTPLTAIRGYAETLLEGGLEDAENSRRFVEIIKAHAIRLGNITSDLLTLSELESPRTGAPPERVSVEAAIDSSLRTVSSAARLGKVNLVRGATEDAAVLGNRTHLEQVLVNLLDNAVKFNRQDGEVRVQSRRGPNGQITIVVEDNGIGIPSEHLPRIFERFYRVDKARSREMGGTGLGLSIVKHIVERMHGTVNVESTLGRGSRFTVTLPTCT